MYKTLTQSIKNQKKQLIIILVTVLVGCTNQATVQAQNHCSIQQYQHIESLVNSGDGMGHGPDIGSDEWKSAIEFRLGVRNHPDTPASDSNEWCQYIGHLAQQGDSANTNHQQGAAGLSFDCTKNQPGSSESLVCGDQQLSALDRKLAEIYSQARKLADNQQPSFLAAEQRGWVKGRDECWKNDDRKGCIADEYRRRIAELQARYQLVDNTGPVSYACGKTPENQVTVTFYETEPKTLIAERGNTHSLMFIERSASGSKYQGGNKSFWESKGVAQIVWGYEASEMICEIRQ
jgi:uncharacterized protein